MLLSLQQPWPFHQGLSVGEIGQKGTAFKLQRGDGTKEGSLDPSRKGDSAKGAPQWDAQGVGHHTQTPFLNPNPFQQWYGVKNMARVRVNGQSCMVLLNSSAQINTIMPSFIKTHSLEVGPLSDLVSRQVTCVGLGNAFIQPSGYMVVRVQVDGVQGYDEDQKALIILDLSGFAVQVPVILGTPMISYVINVIKEKGLMPWQHPM